MSKFDLAGRTALVTGATSGLGRRFAGILSQAGAAVAISGRRTDRLEAVKAEIEHAGGRCADVVFDVTDDARVVSAFDEAEAALGPIDVLVNNAGVSIAGSALELSLADFDSVITTDLRAPYVLAREAGRRMIARKRAGVLSTLPRLGPFVRCPD